MSYDEHLISMAGGDGEPDLDAIQARADAATEGPWDVKECAPCTGRGRLDVSIWAHDGNISIADWCDEDEFTKSDADFIAAARADVPALLAAVRSQQAAIVRVNDLVRYLDRLAPGDKHYAGLIRAALTATEGAA